MAFDAYLKIDGITGESTDKQFTGQTEIQSFSFGVENKTTIGSATGGAGAGRGKLNSFVIKKNIDKASPLLFQNCATGTHAKTATLSVRKAGGTALVYLTYTFTTIFVTDVIWTAGDDIEDKDEGEATAGSGSENPVEEVTFVYQKLEISYQPQDATGKASGGAVVGSWNQATNTTT